MTVEILYLVPALSLSFSHILGMAYGPLTSIEGSTHEALLLRTHFLVLWG